MKNKEHIKFSSYHDTWKTMCCLYGCNWALLTYMHGRIIDIVVPWRKIKLKIECMSKPNLYTMKEVVVNQIVYLWQELVTNHEDRAVLKIICKFINLETRTQLDQVGSKWGFTYSSRCATIRDID
jgi:hypothetical protein